jgi:hypothetical protein
MPTFSEHVLKGVIPIALGIIMALYGACGPRLGTSVFGNQSGEQLKRPPTKLDRIIHITLSLLIVLYGALHLRN